MLTTLVFSRENPGTIWVHRSVTRSELTADGELDVSHGAPATLAVPITAGRYRLDITTPDGSATSRLRFGLGGGDSVERVRVRWPDGSEEEWGALAPGRYHELRQGGGKAVP